MGRSLSVPDDSAQLAISSRPVTVQVKALNRYFQVFRKGLDLYQSEYQLRHDGKVVFRSSRKIEYVVGAGANGYTYLVKRGDYLLEAPLSHYSRLKSWGPSLGYKSNDVGFSRPIIPACINCHSGLPQAVPQRHGLFNNPPFREMSVGCENCHAPGDLHVHSMLHGNIPKGKIDPNNVSPADLP